MNLSELRIYNLAVERRVKKSFSLARDKAKKRKMPHLEEYEIEKISRDLRKKIARFYGLNLSDKKFFFADFFAKEPPLHIKDADLAVSMFVLARLLKKNPNSIAEEVSRYLSERCPYWMNDSRADGPYVNIVLSQEIYGKLLENVRVLSSRYGGCDTHRGEIAYFDYSHPNIAKPIGVGNMRSTIIGEALARIYEASGYTVIRDNFLGDWGAQFGKLIYAYKTWGDQEKVVTDPLGELKALYVRYHKEEEKTPNIKEQSSLLLRRLENGDQEIFKLWKLFRKWSIDGYESLYRRLGVHFDSYLGESFFVERANKVVKECLNKNLARVDRETGAIVVENLGGLPTFVLRKADGSTLYIARDLAAMKFRRFHIKPKPRVMRFVVGNEQALNFEQLFNLSLRAGYIDDINIVKHVSFGLVLSDGKKMSTRKGTAVEFEEVLEEAKEKAEKIMIKREGISRAKLKEVSEIVGTGSVIYNDLRQSRHRDIDFNWDKLISFEGGSAAYLQYTIVRIRSILKQSRTLTKIKIQQCHYEERIEFVLAWKTAWFPYILQRSQNLDMPSVITTYIEELAQLFNNFYSQVNVLKTKEVSLRNSRILLIKSVGQVLENGLAILNVRVPDVM